VTLVARSVNEAMVPPVVGTGAVCVWQEYGVRRSVLSGRNMASAVVKMFSQLIVLKRIL
jgi:hypothetical protein